MTTWAMSAAGPLGDGGRFRLLTLNLTLSGPQASGNTVAQTRGAPATMTANRKKANFALMIHLPPATTRTDSARYTYYAYDVK
jgi:hypothetical protein